MKKTKEETSDNGPSRMLPQQWTDLSRERNQIHSLLRWVRQTKSNIYSKHSKCNTYRFCVVLQTQKTKTWCYFQATWTQQLNTVTQLHQSKSLFPQESLFWQITGGRQENKSGLCETSQSLLCCPQSKHMKREGEKKNLILIVVLKRVLHLITAWFILSIFCFEDLIWKTI